jgi:hypothetical protein
MGEWEEIAPACYLVHHGGLATEMYDLVLIVVSGRLRAHLSIVKTVVTFGMDIARVAAEEGSGQDPVRRREAEKRRRLSQTTKTEERGIVAE